jgi:hypothetical protein
MKYARILLIAGALLLLATAAFHSSGGSMVSGWLQGDRGKILQLLWFLPPIDWGVVALVWLYVAWRPDRRFAPLVWLTAIIPLVMAIMLIAAVGAGFPGIWMLLGAAALASIGAARLR